MNQKNIFPTLIFLMIAITASSFVVENPAKKFSPEGTWAYSAPDVTEGYRSGEMIIMKTEGGYGITFAVNEYSKVEAEKVDYKKKSLTCMLYVEGEEVTISGTFEGNEFTGKVSYSEGDFDFTAVRI